MRWMISALALLAIVPSISAPARSDYLPLETGRTWTYASDGMFRWLEKEVLGPVEFYGQQDIRARWEFEGLGPAYLYFQETAEGDVSIHATELQPDLNLYDPPRVVLDMPLTVGKTWTYSGRVQIYTAGVFVRELDAQANYEVLRTDTINVPGGTFEAIAVEEILSFSGAMNTVFPSHQTSLLASRAPDIYWYAWDVGWVLIESGDRYELESYSVPVARSTNSWGSVKALYGDKR